MLRRFLAAATILLTLTHVGAYLASGWMARTILANRTLDGERQPPERWIALLHEIILRSGAVSVLAALTLFLLLGRERTREELLGFFRAEETPLRLGVFRALFFAGFFIVFPPGEVVFFSRLPPVLIQGLADPLPLWRLIVPAPAITPMLVRLFLVLCFCAMIGFCTRFAALGFVALGFYLLGIPQIYGKVNHDHHLLWCALVLGLSPSGDAFSVDAILRRGLGGAAPPARSRVYGLPIRVIWLLMGILYFWPGFWKVVQHGSAWVHPDTLASHLYLKWFEDPGFSPLFRVDRVPWLCTVGSCLVIAFELSWIFLIPFARTRPIAVALGIVFHNTTSVLMNIAFLSLQICYTVFVDWEAVVRWIRARLGRDEAAPDPTSLARRLRAAPATSALLAFLTRGPGERGAIRGVLAALAVIGGLDMVYGALHATDAWPFACYPTFSTVIKRERRSLYIKIQSPVSGDREAESGKAIAVFRAERYSAVLWGVVHERDEARRHRKLEALADVILFIDDFIAPGETIVIGEAVFSTEPGAGRRPHTDEQLYTFRVQDDRKVRRM
ncbi:MAG: HTTM domain-containing protein [Minicystis sp.]